MTIRAEMQQIAAEPGEAWFRNKIKEAQHKSATAHIYAHLQVFCPRTRPSNS